MRALHEECSDGRVCLESLLGQTCTVLTSSVVVRRGVLLSKGLFDPAIRRGQDFDLWLRLAGQGVSMRYTAQALVRRRVHAAGLSGTPSTEIQRALAVLERATTTLGLTVRERAAARARQRQLRGSLLRECGKELLARHEFLAAWASLSEANATDPSWKLRATLLGLRVAPRLVGAIVDARNQRESVR